MPEGGNASSAERESTDDFPPRPKGGIFDRPFHGTVMVACMAALLVSLVIFSGGNLGGLLLFLPFALPGIIGPAVAAWKGAAWSYVLSAIGFLLLPLLVVAYSPASVLEPQRGPEYIASELMVLSAALGVPTGIAGFRRARRKLPATSLRDGLRTRWGIAAVGVTGLLFGSMMAGAAAWTTATSQAGSPSGIEPEATVAVVAENFLFIPANLTIPVGLITEITVVNKDTAYHTFTYSAGGKTYSHALLGSSTTRFVVFFASAGDIRFWCIPHESMGMVGNLRVA